MPFENESPHNWIAEIAECDLDLTFKALCQVLKRDVEIANNLPAKKRSNCKFKLERNGEGTRPTIRITRYIDGPEKRTDENAIEFDIHKNAIRLDCKHLNKENGNGDTYTMIYPRWDDETSSCKLYIDDKHMKVWEISKLALQPMIFG